MLWSIVSFLLGVFVLLVVLNLIFSVVHIPVIGSIIALVLGVALLIYVVNRIRAAV